MFLLTAYYVIFYMYLLFTLWRMNKYQSINQLSINQSIQGGCATPPNVPKLGVSGVKDTTKTNEDLGRSCYIQVDDSVFSRW